ncbi:MAG: hypothetical protein HYZ49_01190 [Chloroflexi bacterium]|nr:hypothetical protein [Chloroflexota bacterium]
MTDDTSQPNPAENTGGSTNINNTTQGGIGLGEGSQVTIGSGDLTGRDKISAGRDVVQVGAGATVIIGAAPSAPEEEAPAPGNPPFKGLQYFDENDAEWFFGREHLVAKLVGRLRDNRFLAIVIGASGSGKSSIVRAGVIPALKRGETLADGTPPPENSGRWPIHIITPTIHPLESLAASLTRDSESVTATTTLIDDLTRDPRSLHLAVRKALSRNPASRLLVVVDQFEELFTLCKDEPERKAFIDNLITATDPKADGPTSVIITMRADFYANCAAYANLRDALAHQQEYIGPMSPAELRRAIEEPAKHGDWEFEEGLVDHLLHEVGINDDDDQPEPGALPLLSHALLETWKRRRGRKMTFRSYDESGGVRGAIAKTADAVYKSLDANQQTIAQRIFLRLTELGEGQQDTRRRADLAELIPSPEEADTAQLVLKKLVDARLVTTTEHTVEVAHEALIREWPTLREWLAESRERLRVQRQITKEAREWEQQGRDTVDLLQGLRLIQAIEFAEENPGELSQLERAFLEASRQEAQHQQAQREAERQRELDRIKELAETRQHQLETATKLAETEKKNAEEQTRSAARLRRFAAYLAGAFGVALLMVFIAAYFGNQARLTSDANASLADQKAALASTAEADRASAQTQEAVAQVASNLAASEQKIAEVERDRADKQAQVALLNQLAGEGNGRLSTQFDLALLLSIQGNNIASTVDLKGSLLNGLEYTPPLKKFLRGHTAPVKSVVFSPDGKLLVSAGDENDIYLWDVAAQKQSGSPLSGHQNHIASLAVSADGARSVLASGDAGGRIFLWDMTATPPQKLAEFGVGDKTVWALAFSPDGKTLASTSGNNILLWDVSNLPEGVKQIGQPLTGHSAEVLTLAFNPNGDTLASAAGIFDNSIILWNVATQKPIGEPLKGHAYGVHSVAFSPDGKTLASGSEDTRVILWDVVTQKQMASLERHRATVYKVAFSPDGKTLASGSADSTIVFWDVSRSDRLGAHLNTFTGHSSTVYDLAFDSTSSLFASASADTTVILWDTSIRSSLGKTLDGHKSIVRYVAYSPDGKLIASASNDPSVILWNGETGEPIGQPLAGHPLTFSRNNAEITNNINAVAFSPDSKTLADGGRDGKIVLWNVADPASPLQIGGPIDAHTDRVWSVAFSPDGQTLASGSEDKTIKLWDLSDLPNVKLITTLDIAAGGHTDTVRTVVFRPDGKMLASSGKDTTIKLWDVSDLQSVKLIATLRGHTRETVNVAFSPNSQLLAAASEDQTVTLWDAAAPTDDDRPRKRLAGHTSFARAVAFSPDGKILASGSSDANIILWDVESGERIGPPLVSHTDWVRGISFSPDGTKLVSGSSDSKVILWDVSLASWQKRACDIVARNLTQEEWKHYVPNRPYEQTCADYPPGQ